MDKTPQIDSSKNDNSTPKDMPATNPITPQPEVIPPANPVSPQPEVIPPANPVSPQPEVTPAIKPESPVVFPVQSVGAETEKSSGAGLYVLQWLTYAFWLWTVAIISALTATTLSSLLFGTNTGNFATYAVAALAVLLPVSYFCDKYYAKSEPQHKKGASSVIMLIHAVLFGLISVGSLITAIFFAVSFITDSTDVEGKMIGLLTALIVTVYYSLTFLRTLNPSKFSWVQAKYKIIMVIATSVLIVAAIIGPVASTFRQKDDKLIERALYSLTSEINNYTQTNNKLPSSISDVEFDGDAKKAIDKGLVKYEGKGIYVYPYSSSTQSLATTATSISYKYELCVTYKYESENYSSGSSSYYSGNNDTYTTSASTYSHPEGEVCYKLRTR